ncbi:RNA pyrophosphohydrolase [Pseudohoeflea sp. DP4N28-3]|uniref:RNA pyrophosphohydrolase n=1 Tax=Pseudohoeflea coraliihabitans TaxID=2860393 RepID=A0ABS6WM30_9HYPH|nr:RNA pyrophosphohydrolase [Pseudohoeflea sp. DP4N28-3]MBW3096708.1 RNA pyrophosphohydrolase [Pseudohoeflea sp. DP4N28-3]
MDGTDGQDAPQGKKNGPAVQPVAKDSLPYRPCVGIMVLNAKGKVWVGRRLSVGNSEAGGVPQLWQMPQGGIDPGEDHQAAARRELYEETGMRSISLLREAPDWISYDLPDHLIGVGLKGKYRGQRQRWFAYRFDGDESEIAINPPPDGHTPEFDAWKWAKMATLPDLVVGFKKQLYRQVVAAFTPLVDEQS